MLSIICHIKRLLLSLTWLYHHNTGTVGLANRRGTYTSHLGRRRFRNLRRCIGPANNERRTHRWTRILAAVEWSPKPMSFVSVDTWFWTGTETFRPELSWRTANVVVHTRDERPERNGMRERERDCIFYYYCNYCLRFCYRVPNNLVLVISSLRHSLTIDFCP